VHGIHSASLAESFSISEAVSTQVSFEGETDEASTLNTTENVIANFVGLDEEAVYTKLQQKLHKLTL
jgi:hypothetical protein